jgi:hypothetical protein
MRGQTNSPRLIDAKLKLAKIAKFKRLERIMRGKLTKLNRQRHGNHFIEESDAGRAMLTAQFRFGLTMETAMEIAPWCTERELKKLQRAARRMTWRDWSELCRKVGLLINLTYVERQACKLWLAPCDMPMEEVRRRQAKKQRKADRERRQRKRRERREAIDLMRNATKRDDAIMRMLDKTAYQFPDGVIGYEWMPVSVMMKEAGEYKPFRRPDGWRLRNLRDAVHVVLKRLAENDVIQTQLRDGRRGKVLWVRKVSLEELTLPGKADTFSDGRSVGGEKRPKLTLIHRVSG